MPDEPPEITTERRTYKVTAGRWVKDVFEETIVWFCENNDIAVEIREHPHLLTTEVMFDVTGTPVALDGLHDFVEQDARATIALSETRAF